MADNTTLNAGSGGDVIASDDIGGVKHQRVKLSLGADGTAADAPVGGGTEAGTLRVTIASDSTGVVSVDDNGSSITVDNGGTFAVQATLAAETTKVIGTVNIASAQTLATVTNLATIGTSVTPGTSAAHLGKAEDAVHGSGDTGVMALAVRRDADTSLVDATGDYAPLQVNSAGSLKVAITSGAGSGGTSIADGATFTRDTTSVTVGGAVVETSAPTLTNGDAAGLSMTTGGALRVSVASGGVAGAAIDTATGGTDEGVIAIYTRDDALSTLTPAEGDNVQGRTNARGALWVALDSTEPQNVTVAAALPAGTNNIGDVDVLSLPALPTGSNTIGAVNIAASQTLATVTTVATVTNITNQGQLADDATFTVGTTRVNVAGFLADETATDSVDEGDGGAARMTLDRKQIVTQYVHAAAGGCTPYKNLDVDETEDDIKTSAGKLFWLHAMNLTTGVLYLKIYNNVASSVTVGTTVPDLTFPIPTQGDTNGAGFCINFGDHGMQFTTGICIAATTGLADNNSGAPAANALVVNAGYI